jgi:hypothetical protein
LEPRASELLAGMGVEVVLDDVVSDQVVQVLGEKLGQHRVSGCERRK